MLTYIVRLGLIIGVVAGLARPVVAQPAEAAAKVRESRRVSIGFSPAWPWMAAHDVTAPLPALRLGVNLSPRLALDLTGGMLEYSAYGSWSLVDIGARWFFLDGNASPYVMGRVGSYFVDADEGSNATYRYATLGVGAEYAAGFGLTAWAEGGPALVGGERGVYASVGVG